MKKIESREEILATIKASGGKIFSVKFIKKDGSERIMQARLGVKAPLRGGKSTTAHRKHLITAYDMQNGGYRCINLDTIVWIKSSGEVYKVA